MNLLSNLYNELLDCIFFFFFSLFHACHILVPYYDADAEKVLNCLSLLVLVCWIKLHNTFCIVESYFGHITYQQTR